ncbi:MAG: hypothetical protein HY903_13070 [Deltaproteobacteria bacterium]|nr:hypothetical protein [Deltaproteobacteria bacterium]
MGKRWSKGKAGQQRKKERKAQGGVGGEPGTSSGGTMSAFRRGLKAVAGTGGKARDKGGLERVIDLALWAAVVVAAIYFFGRQCR